MTETAPVKCRSLPVADGCVIIDESLIIGYTFTRDIKNSATQMTVELNVPDAVARGKLKSEDLMDKLKRLQTTPVKEGTERGFDFDGD